MNNKNILQQFNGRFIVVHLIAAWLCIAAAATFSLLSDTGILQLVSQLKGQQLMNAIREAGISGEEISGYVLNLAIGETAGLFIALVLSGITCARLKIKWFNLLLLLIVYILLNRFVYNVPALLKLLLYSLTGTAPHIQAKVIINGCLLAAFAVLLYFSKKILLFIRPSP